VITSHILILAGAGTAATGTAGLREVLDVAETARVAGSGKVFARAQTRDTRELSRLVTSRARVPGGVTRMMNRPVVHR
jgi:hypothetical protein